MIEDMSLNMRIKYHRCIYYVNALNAQHFLLCVTKFELLLIKNFYFDIKLLIIRAMDDINMLLCIMIIIHLFD